jgi:xanthine dehydrogenase accessory factor
MCALFTPCGSSSALLDPSSWIGLLQTNEPMVMVSIADIAGSTPREAGAFMVISTTQIAGTVGGGNLEHQLTRKARDWLVQNTVPTAQFMRFPLGPSLGQCCGGSVRVAFHALTPARKAALLQAVIALHAGPGIDPSPVWLVLPSDHNPDGAFGVISGDDALSLGAQFGNLRGGMLADNGQPLPLPVGQAAVSGAGALAVRLDDGAMPVWLFGAGHVGSAIVRALAPLPFNIHWVDSRADYIDHPETSHLHPVYSPNPWEEIADLPAGAMVLILTHSHAEDFEICRAALLRADPGFVGMIGSATKRARFITRMRARAVPDAALARLTCPIGVAGITGKHPAVIAASVAAQLVGMRENMQANGGHGLQEGETADLQIRQSAG